MPLDIQTSLSGGELSPSLHSHADLGKYRTGLALCKNWFVYAQGGIATRPGMEYVNEINDSSSKARLIEFQFNTEQTYALVFTHLKMRVIKDGGAVLEAAKTITGITKASPASVESVGHGFITGDDVYLSNINGMIELNGRFVKITRIDDDNFTLDGIDSTAFTTYVSDGGAARVYTIATPYDEGDLFRLKYTQSADVMTITHPDYQQRELSRTDHDEWSLDTITFASGINPPVISSVTDVGTTPAGPNMNHRYVVTSVSEDGAESKASGVANGVAPALTPEYGIRLSWSSVAGAEYYRVYHEQSDGTGVYGFLAEVDEDGSPVFTDFNLGPDLSETPPKEYNPFDGADKYPSCSTYHQQRLAFGCTNNQPQTLWMSRTGDFNNMDKSRPTRDDDSIEATLSARQVNEIRHMLSIDDLIIFTSGGEWKIKGDQDGVITPSNINFRPQGYRGSSHVPPLVIGDTALYIQEKGARVRDLAYTFESDRYTGNDLTILSRHFFEGYEIVDWCYAQEPYGLVWAVRNDGVLLSLTFLKEHQVYAWTQHETNGLVESVCSISEGSEDAVYFILKRNINGTDKRYIERLHSRVFTDVSGAFCVDCGLTYSGSATTTITNLYHLEGESVVALADGNVVEDLTVENGAVTIPHAAEKVHIGLQYNCDFQTLEIAFQGEVTQSRKKQVSELTLRVLESRGLSAGKSPDKLYDFKERTPAAGYGTIPLITGQQETLIPPEWGNTGQLYVRQRYPLPATVLAVIPEIGFG